jgi:hypothetical protein
MPLDTQLARLEDARLVHRAGNGDLSYLFNHALTQESAYETLLLKKRHEIHRLVADAYERLYPDSLDENAALLAQHYAEAGDDAKTSVYAVCAGDAAARVFAYSEANAHYALALRALTRLPDAEEQQIKRVDTLVKQVSVSLRAEGPVETLKRLAEAESLARPFAMREGATREDRLRLARIQYWQGQALIHHNERRAGIHQLQRVLRVAQAENDPQLLAMPASVIGRSLVAQGRFAQAVPVLTDAIRALEQIHDELEWVLATGFRGVAMTMQGEYAAGIREAERALAHATEWNLPSGMALAHGALGMVHFFGNPLSPSGSHARAMIETASKSGDRLYAYTAYGFLAWSETRAGNCAESEKDLAQAQAIAQEIGGQLLFADWFAAAYAERELRCGQVGRALNLAGEILDPAKGNSSLFAQGFAERIRAEALARIEPGREDEIETYFENSLAKFQEGGARLEAARTRVAWGRMLAQRGNAQAAQEQLEKAALQFRGSGLVDELGEVQRIIASLPA